MAEYLEYEGSIYGVVMDNSLPPDDDELLQMGFTEGDVVCGLYAMDELGNVIYDGWFVVQPGEELPYDAREFWTVGHRS